MKTPLTDAIWLKEYPHDQERDERLERVLEFARKLESSRAEARELVGSINALLPIAAKYCPDESGSVRDKRGDEVASYRGIKTTLLAVAGKAKILLSEDSL